MVSAYQALQRRGDTLTKVPCGFPAGFKGDPHVVQCMCDVLRILRNAGLTQLESFQTSASIR